MKNVPFILWETHTEFLADPNPVLRAWGCGLSGKRTGHQAGFSWRALNEEKPETVSETVRTAGAWMRSPSQRLLPAPGTRDTLAKLGSEAGPQVRVPQGPCRSEARTTAAGTYWALPVRRLTAAGVKSASSAWAMQSCLSGLSMENFQRLKAITERGADAEAGLPWRQDILRFLR